MITLAEAHQVHASLLESLVRLTELKTTNDYFSKIVSTRLEVRKRVGFPTI